MTEEHLSLLSLPFLSLSLDFLHSYRTFRLDWETLFLPISCHSIHSFIRITKSAFFSFFFLSFTSFFSRFFSLPFVLRIEKEYRQSVLVFLLFLPFPFHDLSFFLPFLPIRSLFFPSLSLSLILSNLFCCISLTNSFHTPFGSRFFLFLFLIQSICTDERFLFSLSLSGWTVPSCLTQYIYIYLVCLSSSVREKEWEWKSEKERGKNKIETKFKGCVHHSQTSVFVARKLSLTLSLSLSLSLAPKFLHLKTEREREDHETEHFFSDETSFRRAILEIQNEGNQIMRVIKRKDFLPALIIQMRN